MISKQLLALLSSTSPLLTAHFAQPVIRTLFVCTDDTLGGLLSAVQAAGWSWPPYASNMLWELWQDEAQHSSYFVRVLYNGMVLPLPFCSMSDCPLGEFYDWLHKSAVPKDLLKECLATA
jgi:hypothetical protein